MEQKLNSLTISFAFLISIILHLFIFLSLGNFTFKLSDQLKNKLFTEQQKEKDMMKVVLLYKKQKQWKNKLLNIKNLKHQL